MDAESPPPRRRLRASILDTVGETPAVLLPRLMAAEGLKARLALKLEFFNPAGSVKDRIGLAMIEAAEAAGEITPERSVIIEPTSGNTGIALAFVAAAKGYRLIVVMPDGASLERRKMLKLLGAELELTPAKRGMAGAISRAEEIVAKTRGAWMARQFDNGANPETAGVRMVQGGWRAAVGTGGGKWGTVPWGCGAEPGEDLGRAINNPWCAPNGGV